MHSIILGSKKKTQTFSSRKNLFTAVIQYHQFTKYQEMEDLSKCSPRIANIFSINKQLQLSLLDRNSIIKIFFKHFYKVITSLMEDLCIHFKESLDQGSKAHLFIYLFIFPTLPKLAHKVSHHPFLHWDPGSC